MICKYGHGCCTAPDTSCPRCGKVLFVSYMMITKFTMQKNIVINTVIM